MEVRQLMAEDRQKVFRQVETSLGTASPSPAATRMLLQVAAVPAWVADTQQPIRVTLSPSQASVPGEGRRAVPGHRQCWHPALLERAGALGVMPRVLVALSRDVGRFGRICPPQWGLSWVLTPASSCQSRSPFAHSHWLVLGQSRHHPGTREPQQGPCLSPPSFTVSPPFSPPSPSPSLACSKPVLRDQLTL